MKSVSRYCTQYSSFGCFGVAAIITEAAVGKDLLDDVGDRRVPKDPAIRRPRQQPEPRPQHEAIDAEVFKRPGPAGFGHDAVEVPLQPVRREEGHRAGLSERLIEVDGGLFADRFDPDFEKLAQTFDRVHVREGQHVGSKRCLQRAGPFVLRKSHSVLANQTPRRSSLSPKLCHAESLHARLQWSHDPNTMRICESISITEISF